MSKKSNASKISYVAYVAATVDGRISKENKSKIDWTSKEDWNFFQSSLKKFDALVVGTNTYLMAKKNLDRRNTIVFTSKADKLTSKGSVAFLNPKKYNFEKFTAGKGYKNIAILGGPKVYDFFIKNNLLHEIFVTMEPYIFTSGVPMFEGKFQKHKLTLKSIKKLNKNGTILLHYKVNAN